MEHKAFAFDYEGFIHSLAPVLEQALRSGDVQPLVQFIEDNRERLTDPYEGCPLDSNWKDLVEPKDAHQLGDFALTLFYSPQENVGLGYEWDSTRQLLDTLLSNGEQVVLGRAFGPPSNCFDPGKMGAYFQSPGEVRSNREAVGQLSKNKPEYSDVLSRVEHMLEKAYQKGWGLYVTF
jgi:hypothetical protein